MTTTAPEVADGAGLTRAGQHPITDDPAQRLVVMVVAGVICLLCIPYVPGLAHWAATLRMAIVLPLAGWGLMSLVRLIHRGDVAARWAGLLVIWMLISSALSPERLLSFHGGFGNDRGWILQTTFIAAWAVGRRCGPGGRRLAEIALLVGLGLNAGLIFLQTYADGYGLLATSQGRAVGFASSPVYAGALMSAAVVLVAALLRHSTRWWLWLPAITVFLAAGDLTGSRIAILIAAPLAVAAVVRAGWQQVVGVVGAMALGLLLSSAVLTSAGTISSTSRLTEEGSGGGVGTRVTMWKLGTEAALERPIQGWGTGRFRTATSPRITAEFAAAEGPDKLFFDAHNVVVEQLVTGGVVGLALTAGFAWSVARKVKGPLAWFGLATVTSLFLQPLSIVTVPVALLALGIASTEPFGPPRAARPRVQSGVIAVTTVLVAAGAALGLLVAVTARQVYVAETEHSADAIDDARRFFPRDPALSDTKTQVHQSEAMTFETPEAHAAALESARRTVELEPTRPNWWYRLALVELGSGTGTEAERVAAARAALDQALERNPWSHMALSTHYLLSVEIGDDEAAAAWLDRLTQIDPDFEEVVPIDEDDSGSDRPPR